VNFCNVVKLLTKKYVWIENHNYSLQTHCMFSLALHHKSTSRWKITV